MDKTWWGTAVPSTVSSSSWVCVVGAILSVLTDVVEVGMSWGCHVFYVGGGLVLCSGYVLYVVGSATPSTVSCTELLLFFGGFSGEAMTTLEAPVGCLKTPGGKLSCSGWSHGPTALNLAPLGL